MTQAQSFEEFFEVFVVLMTRIFDMLVVFRVIEVDIGDTRWVLFGLRILCPILKFANGKAFKLHHILSQRACLVTEYVVHHA